MNNDEWHSSECRLKGEIEDLARHGGDGGASDPSDDNCMELLDKLTCDDSGPCLGPGASAAVAETLADVRSDDKFSEDIIDALKKKDIDRILALVISQSQNGDKMSCLPTEAIQEIEKSSSMKQGDPKTVEKLNNWLRSQPKSFATAPLRATVAPIRNESIVSSSSSNMSSNTGFRSNKTIKTETPLPSTSSSSSSVSSVPSSLLPADDFLSLISSTDCKPPSGGTRSHPATPPVSQIPNRPLSSHCVPIRSNEQRKRSETDLDPISYCNYSNQGQPLQQQSMQYLPLNMSQFTQYPSPIMAAQNFYLMPMMNPSDTTGGATGSIMPQPSPIMSQAGSTATQSHPNNQISFLLGSTAFLSVPGSNNTSNTVPNAPINQSGQSVTTGDIIRACNQSISVASISHGGSTGTGGTGSNLPKILPKPQPTIMPRTMQHGHGGGTGSIMINHNHHHQLIQSQLSANANNNTMGISSNQLQHQSQQSSQQQIQQQFKRPSNRKSGIKSGSRSSSNSSSSGSGSVSIKSAVKRAPDPHQPTIINHHLNQSSTISKDTVAVAWEIAEQSVPADDLLQSSSSSSCSSSFVTDLTNSNTVGEFSSFLSQSEPFDEFLDDFVNVNSVVPIDSVSPPPKFAQMIVIQYEFECLASLPQIIEPCRRSAVVQTVSRPVPATVTVIRKPITGSSCLVIARQQPLVSVPPLFDIDLDQLLSISSATAAHNNGLESQRVVQLLLNSQFNRGILKYLLPSSTHPPSHSSPITTVGPIISSKHSHNSNHNNTNQGPLSVCTEHDELIEDDLLADISPVKRDPSHLANLDRFLESCQSISPISGSIMMDPDDGKIDSNTCIRTATGADNDRVNRKSTPIIIDDYLPFQRRSIQSSSSVNLSDYSSINGDIVWLKKAKQRNKWIHNGTHIRSSKALEIPQKHSCLSSNSVSQVDRFLKKKSSYRQSGLNSTKIGVATLAPNKSKQKEKHHRKSNKTRRKSVSLNSSDSPTKTRSHNQWGLLKMKINLSELKIVESTINKSAIDNSSNSSDHSGKIIPQQQTILSIIPPVVTAPAQAQIYQPPIKNSSNTSSNNNPKRIFCTRKEDRRSSALSTASPTKVPRKSALASPVGGKNHRRQKAAHTDEHPPLILKLSTKLINNNEEEDEEEDEEEEEEPEEEEDDDDEEEEEEPEEEVPVIQEQHHQPKATTAATTSGNLKLRLKYFSRESSWTKLNNGGINNSNRSTIIEQSPVPAPVSIPPPPLAISMRSRPQLLAPLQFSPTHSSSDSEIDQSSHLEISCLLRRQEQRDPLSLTTSSTDHHHQSINSSSCNNSSNQSQINTHNNLLGNGNNNSGGQSNANNHNNNNNSASSRLSSQSHLPVPYLVGSDPSVFIDPHEFDLVVVKNSRYKRLISSTSNNTFITNNQSVSSSGISQQLSSGPPITSTPPQPAAIGSQNPPRPPSSSIISSTPQQSSVSASISAVTASIQSSIIDVGSELFVPGCFIERPDNKHGLGFSSHMSSGWSSSNNNRSSPSMPVLAPQEPFSSAGSLPGNSGASASASASSGKHDMNIHGIKSSIASRTNMLYEYGNPSQPSQSYSDPSDRLQQSPLCMTTTNTGGNPSQASQYSNSSSQAATEMRPDSSIKSPFHHQSSYYQQGYGSSCYMSDNSVSATASNNQSKTPHHSSPGIAAAITTCSSHIIQDYQPYFQNASHIQSLPSSDTTSFSSISLTSSYQPISDHQSSKHSSSKRSSSSRSHQSEQTSSKKRKESQSSLQLSGYPNADIYNAAAAAQYSSNIDYYSSGFSDIIGGIDRVKLYEQWTRECSQLGQIYPPNIPWNTAMAEYCKQVSSSLIPQSANSTSASGFGLGNSNPLSLTSNLHGADYPNDISHSVESLKPYLDPYTAYAMTQPYMYSAFGLPK